MTMAHPFVLLFLFIRGAPVCLVCRSALASANRRPLALASAVPSLSIIVVIIEIGLKTKAIAGALLPSSGGRATVASD